MSRDVIVLFLVLALSATNVAGFMQLPLADLGKRPFGKAVPGNGCVSGYSRVVTKLASSSDDVVQQALKAKEAAEEAANRAAALRSRSEPLVEVTPSSLTPQEERTQSDNARAAKLRFEHKFIKTQLTKPMGLVLEENHPSVGGVFVASIAAGSPAEAFGLKQGVQMVSVEGQSMMGKSFEEVMDALRAAPSPCAVEFYEGSSGSLYGGWEAEAKGRPVVIDGINRPSKTLIDRIRSGL